MWAAAVAEEGKSGPAAVDFPPPRVALVSQPSSARPTKPRGEPLFSCGSVRGGIAQRLGAGYGRRTSQISTYPPDKVLSGPGDTSPGSRTASDPRSTYVAISSGCGVVGLRKRPSRPSYTEFMPPDEVIHSLLTLANEAFPGIFEPRPAHFLSSGWMPLAMPPNIRSHPAHKTFMDAVAEDRLLRRLLDSEVEDFGALVTSAMGGGWRVQHEALAENLLMSAARCVVAKGMETDNREVFLVEVEEQLDALRHLIAGEAVDVLVVQAFDGAAITADVQVPTPWGVLRAASDLEQLIHPFGMAPSVMLVTEVTTEFRVGEPSTDFPSVEASMAQEAARDRARRLLSLAALLALRRADYVLLDHVWVTTVEPASAGVGFHRAGPPRGGWSTGLAHMWPRPRDGGNPLTDEELDELTSWMSLVEGHYDPAIDVAVRRTTTAILERADPEDALIDAVIALENLFGPRDAVETTFRVAAAVALLQETNQAKRSRLMKDLRQTFRLRGKVVHGGQVDDQDRLIERKDFAIKTAVETLRTLFSQRPTLIPDMDRGTRLILGD